MVCRRVACLQRFIEALQAKRVFDSVLREALRLRREASASVASGEKDSPSQKRFCLCAVKYASLLERLLQATPSESSPSPTAYDKRDSSCCDSPPSTALAEDPFSAKEEAESLAGEGSAPFAEELAVVATVNATLSKVRGKEVKAQVKVLFAAVLTNLSLALLNLKSGEAAAETAAIEAEKTISTVKTELGSQRGLLPSMWVPVPHKPRGEAEASLAQNAFEGEHPTSEQSQFLSKVRVLTKKKAPNACCTCARRTLLLALLRIADSPGCRRRDFSALASRESPSRTETLSIGCWPSVLSSEKLTLCVFRAGGLGLFRNFESNSRTA